MDIGLLYIFISEVIGTFLLILIGCGVNASVSLKKSHSNDSGWIVITFGWAMGVMIGATVALYSGGHLNPAVTISQAVLYMITPLEAVIYLAGELLGAFLGALAVAFLFWDHFKATEDQGAVLGTFATSPAIENKVRNLASEIFGTFVLIMAIMASIFYADSFTMFGPLFAALVVLGIGIGLGGLTGYAINPARDLMPRLVHWMLPISNKGDSNWAYSWVPIVGPIVGAILASLVVLAVIGMSQDMTWSDNIKGAGDVLNIINA